MSRGLTFLLAITVAVVLAGFLVFAGAGSGVSARFLAAHPERTRLFTVVAAIVAVAVAWLTLLPSLFERLAGLGDAGRIAVALAAIAPLAFFMGMPFPIGLTRTAALEYAAQGIRVNAVCPGTIDTQIARDVVAGDEGAYEAMAQRIPLGRIGRPDEIASAVLWLCSPGAGFVVGQALVIDGGETVR